MTRAKYGGFTLVLVAQIAVFWEVLRIGKLVTARHLICCSKHNIGVGFEANAHVNNTTAYNRPEPASQLIKPPMKSDIENLLGESRAWLAAQDSPTAQSQKWYAFGNFKTFLDRIEMEPVEAEIASAVMHCAITFQTSSTGLLTTAKISQHSVSAQT